MTKKLGICSLTAALLLTATLADAHVSIASGPGFANATNILRFSVGHGCEGKDTYRIKVSIPAGATSVRPEASAFGRVSVQKDATDAVTSVTWQKADADTLEGDIAYYQLNVRLRLPDQPFTTLQFNVEQTCRAADGTLETVNWDQADPESDYAAARVNIVPARKAGWNKYSVPRAIPEAELAAFFGDALIVWKGNSAYSANASTSELIPTTSGVTPLTSLAAGDEIWVKY